MGDLGGQEGVLGGDKRYVFIELSSVLIKFAVYVDLKTTYRATLGTPIFR